MTPEVNKAKVEVKVGVKVKVGVEVKVRVKVEVGYDVRHYDRKDVCLSTCVHV